MNAMNLQPAGANFTSAPAPELRVLVLVGLLPLITGGCGPPF
jgi:hypothetical protein